MRGGTALAAALAAVVALAAPALAADSETPPGRRREDVVSRHLVAGRLDYAALRRDRALLERDIAALAAADTTGWTSLHRAALHVDLYNRAMVRAVLERWKPGWTPAADGFAVFKVPLVPTRNGLISLDELEKRRTLATFGDPRLHVAFNCAAASCPPLAARLWTAHDDVGATLERAMTAFVRDTTRNQVDHAKRLLRLSRVFDWYAADFGGRAGVLRTVSKYLGRDVSGYRVEFLEYDWSLNAATFPDGSKPR